MQSAEEHLEHVVEGKGRQDHAADPVEIVAPVDDEDKVNVDAESTDSEGETPLDMDFDNTPVDVGATVLVGDNTVYFSFIAH
jgi:hypothetical protein